MILTSDDAIERLALRLLDRTLPKAEWTHEGHFAAALWLLRFRPELTTDDAFRAIITGYNEATGTGNTDGGGYHHTITRASVQAAGRCLDTGAPGTPLHAVLAELMASRLGRSDWLLAHWRRETLFSVEARRGWVAPDLLALE